MKLVKIKSAPKIEPQPLEGFLSCHGIVHGQWDLLLFGDGSGLSWKMGGGFAAILVDGRKGIRSHIVGAQSLATVNRMELGAYTQILAYHFELILDGRITDPPYRTFIFTDSEFTMKSGRGLSTVQKNRDLWNTVSWFELQGYRFDWRWVPRNSTPYHELADYLAGTARHVINEANMAGDALHSLMPYSRQLAVDVELAMCPTCKTPLAPVDMDGIVKHCPVCGPQREE